MTTAVVADFIPMIVVLAHQGGWDEGLLVAAPLLIVVVLLAVAKRRADRIQRDRDAT